MDTSFCPTLGPPGDGVEKALIYSISSFTSFTPTIPWCQGGTWHQFSFRLRAAPELYGSPELGVWGPSCIGDPAGAPKKKSNITPFVDWSAWCKAFDGFRLVLRYQSQKAYFKSNPYLDLICLGKLWKWWVSRQETRCIGRGVVGITRNLQIKLLLMPRCCSLI